MSSWVVGSFDIHGTRGDLDPALELVPGGVFLWIRQVVPVPLDSRVTPVSHA